MSIVSARMVYTRFRSGWLVSLLFMSVTAYAQQGISVQLVLVNRLASTTGREAGLLLDVKNQLQQNVALFTPLGDLMPYVRFYRLNTRTNQYAEIKNPFYEDIKKENALTDSIFNATGAIVDFFGREDYRSKSGLYQQFTRDDTLWYDHLSNTGQYEKSIRETDVQQFRQIAGLDREAVSFTLIKAGECYQDFCNVTFLYQQQGTYKIVLELPPLDLHGAAPWVGNFRVKEPGIMSSHELYLQVP